MPVISNSPALMTGWPFKTTASLALESTTTAPQPFTVTLLGLPFKVREP